MDVASGSQWECVVIESPYNGTAEEIKRNVQYAIHAMRDCLLRGEAPFASHLLYTQAPNSKYRFVSDDDEETVCVGREAAIEAGICWGRKADKTVIYQDLGITPGMMYGIKSAEEYGRPVEYRNLPKFKELFEIS